MKTLLHLSDIHYRNDWPEEQGVVFNSFFHDLKNQIEKNVLGELYLVISGDIVQAGENKDLYDEFISIFKKEFDVVGVTQDRRICAPGNHDVSLHELSRNKVEHDGVISQLNNERDFNDYISRKTTVFNSKFKNYRVFEKKFCLQNVEILLTNSIVNIDPDISIFLINTALTSRGDSSIDKGELCIDTRSLNKWVQETQAKCKILVMHHPIDWLNEWSRKELKEVMDHDVSLILYGHEHDQDFYHRIPSNTE